MTSWSYHSRTLLDVPKITYPCLLYIAVVFFGVLESFTADHKPLLGEDVNVRGFFHGCGFNSLGINGSGGCGRELADWVLDGRPQLDMFAYDIRLVFVFIL